MKKIISFFLSVIMALSFTSVAFAENTTAELYNVYGDEMLFAQNKEAVFAGTAKAGAEISVELYNADGLLVAGEKSIAKADGTFEVSFIAPSGSYDEYTVVLKENGAEFSRLSNIVFGELWLASGQSNMQYPLSQSKTGVTMNENGQKLSKWLRVLLVPAYPGNTAAPEFTYAEPQLNIEGTQWVTGENAAVYSMSAVAYFFAADLMKELDMPVGILNASLGGTAIATWLSREAIDGDEKVKNDLVSADDYVELSEWKVSGQDVYSDMTANYNHKIEALGNFRPSGMIWYQGESDIGRSAERYERAFDLMQRSYSELFGFEEELMPFIFSHLASFIYSDDTFMVPDRNMLFTEIQQARPESRAVIPIYDVPLTYIPVAGAIHPECKEEIGQRMAVATENLVYGGNGVRSAPTVENAEIRDGAVYVTLDNTGDGLVCDENELKGFAVCGANGVYVQAEAEIVAPDTVKIYSPYVENPRSASYAYCLSNMNSNLYASENGKPVMPVSHFITDKTVSKHYWLDRAWTDCDDSQMWHVMDGDTHIKYYDSWVSEGAEISFSDGAMTVRNSENSFAVSPLMTFTENSLTKALHDTDSDYGDYGKMSFYLRNNGDEAVTLEKVKFGINQLLWYAPEVDGTKDINAVIPADGEWHLVTLNLNKLYLYGNEGGASRPCSRLGNVKEIRFEFSSEGESSVSIDSIRFAPSDKKAGVQFDADINNADTFIEKITAFFVGIIGKIVSMFKF